MPIKAKSKKNHFNWRFRSDHKEGPPLLLGLFLLPVPTAFSIDNLKLNEHLDYGSDSLDGPLITGSDAQAGFVPGKPNYVIMYGKESQLKEAGTPDG